MDSYTRTVLRVLGIGTLLTVGLFFIMFLTGMMM
jgi:hypothetical protein